MTLNHAIKHVMAALLAAALIGCAAEPNDFPPKPDTETPAATSDVVVSTVGPGATSTTTTAPLPRPTGLATNTPDQGVTVSTVEPPAPPTHIAGGQGGGQIQATPTVILSNGPRDVTMADNNTTITLAVGQTLQLKLNPDMAWAIEVSDKNVLVQLLTFAAIPGVQASYEAFKAGRTTLSATGTAICKPNEMCPMIAMLFKVDIVVK